MKLLQYIRKAFNWLTRYERFTLINGTCFKKEDLTDDEIKEIEILQMIDQEEQK